MCSEGSVINFEVNNCLINTELEIANVFYRIPSVLNNTVYLKKCSGEIFFKCNQVENTSVTTTENSKISNQGIFKNNNFNLTTSQDSILFNITGYLELYNNNINISNSSYRTIFYYNDSSNMDIKLINNSFNNVGIAFVSNGRVIIGGNDFLNFTKNAIQGSTVLQYANIVNNVYKPDSF